MHLPSVRRALRATVTAATALLATAGFNAPIGLPVRADHPIAARNIPSPAQGLVTDHVVVISVDGLRPDAIEKFGARTMMMMMREGSYSLQAQTIMPSRTLPSHTSMLTGVEPDGHGITWNSDQTHSHGTVDALTIFGAAREKGFRTAAFFSKSKFHHLQVAGSLDHTAAPRGSNGKWTAGRTTEYVENYLERARPNLLFVHIAEPDYVGHTLGWMSWAYKHAVRTADKAVAEVIEESDRAFGRGNYTLILTADHGGHGRDHGTDDPRDTTIPWIVWGKGVRGGTELPAGIRTMDTAATALWLLGVDVPSDWIGRPVLGAFETPPALARAS